MASIKRSIGLRNLVQELANNKVDPLELLREALSNARDHQAKNVWIRTARGKPPKNAVDIVVVNDGEGMTAQQTAAFWGVSSSVKEDPSRSIGYKGHGSKLFFSCRKLLGPRCCDVRARGSCARQRHRSHAETGKEAPCADVRMRSTPLCLATPAEFSGNSQYGLVMRVEGKRRQLDSYPEASRQPRGGLFEFDQRFGLWICRDFVPIEIKSDWLALALERATEKSRKRLRFDLSKTRFWQVFVNSQEFVLTANRNNVANAAMHKSAIIELVASKIAEALKDDAFRDWIENLQRAVTTSRRTREIEAIKERLDDVTKWFKKAAKSDIEPTQARLVARLPEEDSLRLPSPQSEQEFFYLYSVLTGRYAMPLRIIEYDTRLGIDAIAQVTDSKLFAPPIAYARVELKHTVSANISLGHYLDAIDAVLCWTVRGTGPIPDAGDSPLIGQLAKRTKPRLRSKLDSYEITYDVDGKTRTIPVLVVDKMFKAVAG